MWRYVPRAGHVAAQDEAVSINSILKNKDRGVISGFS